MTMHQPCCQVMHDAKAEKYFSAFFCFGKWGGIHYYGSRNNEVDLMSRYLVFDWGGTFMKYALMNEEADILEKGKVKSPGKKDTVESFFAVIDGIVEKYPGIDGIAISSPGIINSTQGVIDVVGVFPYLQKLPLTQMFQERYGVPASVENDGKAAALAEVWKGNLSDVRDGAVFLIGTSIGGGIVLDGKLRRGKDFFAGEYSSMCVNIASPSSTSSYVAQLGTSGLIEKVMGYMELDEKIDGEQAFAYINAGEPNALKALKKYTDDLALTIFSINVLLDVEKVVIGGGISQQPLLLEYLKQSIQEIRTYHPDFLGGIRLPLPQVDTCRFYNDANLIGALYHFLYETAE